MTIPRPVSPLVRTTIDLQIDRPDRYVNTRLFGGWGVDMPGSRIF